MGVGGVRFFGKKRYEDVRFNVIWPIPCHVCYSLDSIFCKQLRKLSILNDIHILVYYLAFAMNLHACCIHWHRNISNTAAYFPSRPHLAVSRVLHRLRASLARFSLARVSLTRASLARFILTRSQFGTFQFGAMPVWRVSLWRVFHFCA